MLPKCLRKDEHLKPTRLPCTSRVSIPSFTTNTSTLSIRQPRRETVVLTCYLKDGKGNQQKPETDSPQNLVIVRNLKRINGHDDKGHETIRFIPKTRKCNEK